MKSITQTKIIDRTLIGIKTKDIAWTVGLILVATLAPAIFAYTPQNQWLTGTLVNATLFLAAYYLPLINAVLISVIPSTIALSHGLLPFPMATFIPYIIFSNILLIASFKFLKEKPLFGILVGSFIKFSFLYFLTFLFFKQINTPLVSMFHWPQLATALAGGLLFISGLKIFKIKI